MNNNVTKIFLPGDSGNENTIINIYGTHNAYAINYKVVNDFEDQDSLYVTGTLAERTLYFMENDVREEHNCHGAALSVLGLAESHWFKVNELVDVYQQHKMRFKSGYANSLGLLHCITEEFGFFKRPKLTEENLIHSAVYLGERNGISICFEKRGNDTAQFTWVKAMVYHYAHENRVQELFLLHNKRNYFSNLF